MTAKGNTNCRAERSELCAQTRANNLAGGMPDFLEYPFYCGRSQKGMPYIMPKTGSDRKCGTLTYGYMRTETNRWRNEWECLIGSWSVTIGISFNGRMISILIL